MAMYFSVDDAKFTDVIVEMTYTLRNKGTKAVTVAVPFQKEHFCTY